MSLQIRARAPGFLATTVILPDGLAVARVSGRRQPGVGEIQSLNGG